MCPPEERRLTLRIRELEATQNALCARAHAEGKAEGRREMLRVLDEAVTTLEAPRNGPQYGEIHEVIEAARQGVLAEYLASQDGDLDRILRAFAARSLIPAAPQPRPLPAGEERE